MDGIADVAPTELCCPTCGRVLASMTPYAEDTFLIEIDNVVTVDGCHTCPGPDLGQRYSDRVTQDRPLTDTDQQLIHELLDDGTTDPPLDVIAEGALTILPGARVVMNGQEIGRVVSSARGIPATMSIDGAALGLTVTNWKQRAEAAEAELERFEPWCSCGTRKGERADGTLICLAGVDHGDRLPTHWTKRP